MQKLKAMAYSCNGTGMGSRISFGARLLSDSRLKKVKEKLGDKMPFLH